ncbi:E3 ubiquitin-protein ligase Topors isoform X2 [Cryptotermes secundus]|uniref:E3 ubiquitin-protein ligase Topors isoform X2 n=1 Tax=Cryptotermes secundus TaxID=105785 RepID=UPI000CD7DEA0|nr:E3 ubiquitin-protein ligase Topors isoform X2 [Cryptotermes secundus]
MEPVRWPALPPAEAGPSAKSPREDRPPASANSPTLEREKSATPTNEHPSSPEPNCAICLGKSQNKSFTDSCLHQFCFNCLLEWSKVKPECPLCKQSFKSIIHNVRSNEDYDQYHLHPASENPYPWLNMINMDMAQQRFRYRSTLTPDRHLERVMGYLEHDLQRRVEPGDVVPTQRSWRQWRGVAPPEFRRNVYSQNLWLTSLLSVGQPRDVSPQNFRNHPEEMHRLIPWLNRELQVVMRSPGLAARVLDLVISLLPQHHIHSREFRSQLETYLREHYNHFIHEFYVFARSPYDMIGFDENARYSMDMVHEVLSDSSDSDVVILPSDEGHPSSRSHNMMTPVAPPGCSSPVAGPSRVVLPVDQASNSDVNNASSSHSDISLSGDIQDFTRSREVAEVEPLQSNDGNDSDGCVVVGYVKPRHERTPEIITLLSSEPEAEEDDVIEMSQMACTGCYDRSYGYELSSTSSPESSGSEYDPYPVRKSQKKKRKKKKKKKIQRKGKLGSAAKSKARTSRKDDKIAATSTKKKGHSKAEYSNSDSDSSACTCTGKKSVRRRRARSFSSCSSSSSVSRYSRSSSNASRISHSSISSSNSNPTYRSQKSRSSCTRHRIKHSPCRNKKESWRIQINMPDMRQEHDYSDTGCESRSTSDINGSLQRGSSNGRPKLRSIVITRAANCNSKYQASESSSHDKLQKSSTLKSKSHRQEEAQKKVKNEPSIAPSTLSISRPHHSGDSHSSHSSHRFEGSNRSLSKSNGSTRQKHSKENGRRKEKVADKKQRGSGSSLEREAHETKPKKRKRILPSFSESSND